MRVVVCLLLVSVVGANVRAATVDTLDQLMLQLNRAGIGEVIEVDGALLGGVIDSVVKFERIELRAPGADVYVERAGERVQFNYPRRKVFMGRTDEDAKSRVGLLFDPVGLRIDGTLFSVNGMRSLTLSSERGWQIEAQTLESELPSGPELIETCGNVAMDQYHRAPQFQAQAAADLLSSSQRSTLRYGVLALDTDIQWLDKRFGDDETAAAEWMEELMIATNTLFEAQLNLRMLQGDTILRTESDPYDEESSGVTSSHLNEFGSYWENNQGGVERTHAALVSGNSDSENSASGIAWVNSYCQEQSSGGSYSANQLFWNNSLPAAASARLFAHEIGHNLGSVHTHCYDPPVDQCWAQETPSPPCFDGTPSCPMEGGEEVAGTLMSYCNRNGCGSNKMELAPEVESVLNQVVDDNTPSCLSTEIDEFVIFEDRFES